MNKVLQAAGRVIRTSEDRGVILLLDERFLQREYGALFPREWEKRSYGLGANSDILRMLPDTMQLIFGGSGIVPAAIVALVLNIVLPKDEA